MRPKPVEGYYEPPDGWKFALRRHAYHDCGWSTWVDAEQAGLFLAAVEAYYSTCPWPDVPVVDTPEG